MRIGLERWAAACAPLTLFAVTACGGPEGSGAQSPTDGRTVSSIDDASRDSSGRDSNPSRDSGSRGTGALGETAGPGGGGPGELGREGEGQAGEAAGAGRVPAEWPADDVTGAVPQAGPGAGGAGPGRRDPVSLTYDAGAADGFAAAIRAGAESWNDRVPEVELRPARAGTEADIRIVATKGWPGADPEGLGKGTISIGRRALAQGHDAIRIVSHEFGHLLGLEDRQPGPCSSVMSGKSPGAACTNSYPNAAEVREVRRNFGSGAAPVTAP